MKPNEKGSSSKRKPQGSKKKNKYKKSGGKKVTEATPPQMSNHMPTSPLSEGALKVTSFGSSEILDMAMQLKKHSVPSIPKLNLRKVQPKADFKSGLIKSLTKKRAKSKPKIHSRKKAPQKPKTQR